MRLRFPWLFLATLLSVTLLWVEPTVAQSELPSVGFRRGNELASRSRWEEAGLEYGRLARDDVRAPALYWNWAQVAVASGKKGEALWALLSARELTPGDSSIQRELERVRGELGLDPSEVSLGLIGDARVIARRFRFDGFAVVAMGLSVIAALLRKVRTTLSLASFLVGLILMSPFFAGSWREPRGVVVRKDAPLVDIPRDDAIALANLREGEAVPLLGEEGDYVRIQDASGARGFAHKSDVRRIGMK